MIETVLVLPIVLGVLALVILLGRSMARYEQSSVMDRYEAWRYVWRAPGPNGAPGAPANDGQLNETFLRDRASSVRATYSDYFPSEPGDLLLNAARGRSQDAGWLVERALEVLPGGRRVRVRVTFPSDVPLEQRLGLAGPMQHAHVRLDREWQLAQGIEYNGADQRWEPDGPFVAINEAIRERFLSDLDGRLAPMASSGNVVARTMRGTYRSICGYGGPYLDVPNSP